MTLDRRCFLLACGVLGSGLAGFAARAQSVALDLLLEPGPLGDRILGADDAPVTVVEYASFTCNHCANFHAQTFQAVKRDYIDTGAIRFVFREFPLNNIDLAAAMFARCVPPERYFDLVDLLFERQQQWAFGDDAYTQLLAIARQIGYGQEAFDACLSDQETLDALDIVARHAAEEFGVNATPTLFFNGVRKAGFMSLEQFGEEIERNR